MRLISKEDATLAIVLIFSAVIVFLRPLRFLLDAAYEVETRYGLDLIPALTVLMAVLVFHEHRKRLWARMEKLELEIEVGKERARSVELERCIGFAGALAESRDEKTLERSLWEHLPNFVGEEAWLLMCKRDTWRLLFQKKPQSDPRRPVEDLEALSRKTLDEARSKGFRPVVMPEETCFPLVVGGAAVGVLGVRHAKKLTVLEQESLLMATALIALTITNIQQFQEITEEGVRDSLTGCYNRRHAVERLSGELRRASRNGTTVSILMLDLDEFKRVNDECGHGGGDRVLAKVGSQLRQSLRSTDIACRYGGDEFLIVLPETAGPAAEHVARGLQRALSALTFESGDTIGPITVSIGVAASAGDLGPEAMIEKADRFLFTAKRAGRNQFSTVADLDLSATAS